MSSPEQLEKQPSHVPYAIILGAFLSLRTPDISI